MNYLELLMMVLGLLVMFFLMSTQPIMMVFLLVLITLFYSFFIYKFMSMYWFSYALIMVMLSGVLVLFTYMASLVPNEMFEIYSLIFIMIFLLYFVFDIFIDFINNFGFISLNLWSVYVGLFNLFLVMFLFMIMLMVVWISCLDEGAVRVY